MSHQFLVTWWCFLSIFASCEGMSFNPFGRLPNLGGSQTPKLPQYETYQKNLEVASKSEHDIQELKKASAFGEAPNKILGGAQQKFGRLPIKFWESPKKFLRGSKIFRNPIFFFFSRTYGGSIMLKGFKILGGSQSNFGMLRTFWEAPNFFFFLKETQ